jgi:hypothetical protein
LFVYRNELKNNYRLRVNLIQDESGTVDKFNDAVSNKWENYFCRNKCRPTWG